MVDTVGFLVLGIEFFFSPVLTLAVSPFTLNIKATHVCSCYMSFSVFSFVPFLLDSALKLILFCPWNWIVLRHWYIPSYLISQDHKSWKEPTRLFESMVVVGLHPNCDIQALQRQYFLRKSEGPGKLRSALGYQNQSRVEAEPNLEPQVFIIGCTDWITTTIVIIILTASCPSTVFFLFYNSIIAVSTTTFIGFRFEY